MRGRSQAVMVAAVCTVLSLIVPALGPLGYLGAGAIGLVTLRHGPRESVVVMGWTALAAAALTWMILGSPLPVLATALLLWLPVWLLALLLAQSASQGIALAAAGLLGLLALIGVHLLVGSPEAQWRELLEKMLVPVLEMQGIPVDSGTLAEAARLMTGLVVAVSVLGVWLSVLLGRWWQSLLYNPGGFGQEFRALRMDRRVALGTLVVLLATSLVGDALGALGIELMVLAVVLYMVQGLAVVHAVVAGRRAAVVWLVVLYIALLLFWPFNIYLMLFLSVGGFVDAFVDWRARLGSK